MAESTPSLQPWRESNRCRRRDICHPGLAREGGKRQVWQPLRDGSRCGMVSSLSAVGSFERDEAFCRIEE